MIFTWVDGAVAIIVLLYLWQGWNKSVMEVWSEWISWIGAYVLTMWWKPSVIWWLVIKLGVEKHWAEYAAFFLLMIVIQQIIYWSGYKLSLRWPSHYKPWFSQLFWCTIQTFCSGLAVAGLILAAFMAWPTNYPLKMELINSVAGKVVILALGL